MLSHVAPSCSVELLLLDQLGMRQMTGWVQLPLSTLGFGCHWLLNISTGKTLPAGTVLAFRYLPRVG